MSSYRRSRPTYRRRRGPGLAGRTVREQRLELGRRAEDADEWWERLGAEGAEPWDEWHTEGEDK